MNEILKSPKDICLHKNDLPDNIDFSKYKWVSIDTEAMGLNYTRDRLCLVQLTFDGEICHLIQFSPNDYHLSKNLIKLFESDIQKLMHFARFDAGLIYNTFGVIPKNIYCTKIASKLARTYTERHGLKTLYSELLGVEISKKAQSSDWGSSNLTQAQQYYAATDVLHLHLIKEKLEEMLKREGREEIAYECFKALECIIKLDCSGWSESLFAHL